MGSIGHPLQHACLPERPGRGRATPQVLGPDVEIRLHTYDETNRRMRPDRIIRMISQARRQGADRPRRRAVQSVSARGRSCRPVPRGGPAGLHRRLPCLRLHRHAAGDAAGDARCAGARHLVLCRRSRGRPARPGCCAMPGRASSRRFTITWTSCRRFEGEPAADPAAQARAPDLRIAVEHRSRPRLPLSMLVLHHHQRAGPQEPLPHRRTISSRSSARTTPRASSASSSPTTISPATAIGKRCSTA